MTHTYQVTGMTCSGCEEKVKSSLLMIEEVTSVDVSKTDYSATITMNKNIALSTLQKSLPVKYHISTIESCKIEQRPKLNDVFNWKDISVWKRAGFNTLNCLIGCSIGDFSMVIFLQYFYPETSMYIQMILATITGLITSIALETSLLHFREKLIWKRAITIAIGMSFISMIAMEIAMNTTDFMITGGKLALNNPNYWLAFIPSAIVGFLVPLPYNYYQLKRHNKSCH